MTEEKGGFLTHGPGDFEKDFKAGIADSLAESCKKMARTMMRLRNDRIPDPVMEAYTLT